MIVGYLPPSPSRERGYVTLTADEVSQEFSQLNERITQDFKKLRERVSEMGKDLRGVYLRGGGSNLESFKKSIEEAASADTNVPIWVMDLAGPLANKLFDAKIVGASIGAALPDSQYLKILKYALPLHLIVRYVARVTVTDATFYPKGQQIEKGHFQLNGVDRGCPIRILTENRRAVEQVAEVLFSNVLKLGEKAHDEKIT